MKSQSDCVGNDELLKLSTLQKWQIIIMIVISVFTVIISIVGSWKSGQQAAQAAIVEKGVLTHSLDQEREFVRKDEFNVLRTKIDRIAEDAAETKGYVKALMKR